MSNPTFNTSDSKSFGKPESEFLSHDQQFTKLDADMELNATLNYNSPQTHAMFSMNTLHPNLNVADVHKQQLTEHMEKIRTFSKNKSSASVDEYFDEPN